MAATNIYTIKDEQQYLDQTVLNVYHYQQVDAGDAVAEGLATAFVSEVLPALLAIQGVGVVHHNIVVESHEDLSDFFTLALTTDNVGEVSGNGLPPYATWSFLYLRADRSVRNGGKRIAGVSESVSSDGIADDGILDELAAAAAAMGTTLDIGSSIAFLPVIVHKAAGDPTAWTAHNILGVEYRAIGTQNTRKFGRGS